MHHITIESIPVLTSIEGSGTGVNLGGICGIEVGVFKCGGGVKQAVFGVSLLLCPALGYNDAIACHLWSESADIATTGDADMGPRRTDTWARATAIRTVRCCGYGWDQSATGLGRAVADSLLQW